MRLLGQGLLVGGGGKNISSFILEDFSINRFGLKNNKVFVTSFTRSPNSELNSFNKPYSHNKGFISYYLRGGTINLSLTIKGKNKTEFMDLINDLYKEIYSEKCVLRFKINGVVRIVEVFCTSAPINFLHYNINSIELNLSFDYLDYIKAEEKQSLSLIGKNQDFLLDLNNSGNAYSYLNFTFLFKEGTNLTKIKIKNGEDFIEVKNNFSSGDKLIISGDNKEVYKNEEVIDYDGVILGIKPQLNFLQFEFEGDFLCDIFILNDKTYK